MAKLGFFRAVGLAAVFGAAGAGWAADAAACDCAGPDEVLPNAKTARVPSNTRVWVRSYMCPNPTLRDPQGATVEATTTTLEVARSAITVLSPKAELTVGLTYTLPGCGSQGKVSFTVTDGPDTTPPPTPVVTQGEFVQSNDGGDCGGNTYAPLSLSTGGGDVLLLDVAGKASVDAETLSGSAVDAFFSPASPYVGERVCASNWFFKNGNATAVRIAAFDLAGNLSGWSTPQTVSAPGECGCSCSFPGGTTGGAGLGLAALFASAAALGRRRSRR